MTAGCCVRGFARRLILEEEGPSRIRLLLARVVHGCIYAAICSPFVCDRPTNIPKQTIENSFRLQRSCLQVTLVTRNSDNDLRCLPAADRFEEAPD